MSNLKIHYQISTTELTNESNFKSSDFIIKITSGQVYDLNDGSGNLGIDSEYKVYKSEADRVAGFMPFKLVNAEGKRVANSIGFSLEPWSNFISTDNYTDIQKAIITDLFGVPAENITVVPDTPETPAE